MRHTQNWPGGHKGPIRATHVGPIWAPPWTNLGPTRAVHTGHKWGGGRRATYGWPTCGHAELARGLQGAHSGDTHGTHMGPTVDPSGPHTGSPYGPQVGPMRVARMATYGRPTWGPHKIGHGATRGPFGRYTWDPYAPTIDPSDPHMGSTYGPQVAP